MTDTRGLPSGVASLISRLVFTPRRRSPPVLTLRCWCPYCRREHSHGWPEPGWPLTASVHRAAHCDTGPLLTGGNWIMPDPALADANRQALADYRRAMGNASTVPTAIVT